MCFPARTQPEECSLIAGDNGAGGLPQAHLMTGTLTAAGDNQYGHDGWFLFRGTVSVEERMCVSCKELKRTVVFSFIIMHLLSCIKKHKYDQVATVCMQP